MLKKLFVTGVVAVAVVEGFFAVINTTVDHALTPPEPPQFVAAQPDPSPVTQGVAGVDILPLYDLEFVKWYPWPGPERPVRVMPGEGAWEFGVSTYVVSHFGMNDLSKPDAVGCLLVSNWDGFTIDTSIFDSYGPFLDGRAWAVKQMGVLPADENAYLSFLLGLLKRDPACTEVYTWFAGGELIWTEDFLGRVTDVSFLPPLEADQIYVAYGDVNGDGLFEEPVFFQPEVVVILPAPDWEVIRVTFDSTRTRYGIQELTDMYLVALKYYLHK